MFFFISKLFIAFCVGHFLTHLSPFCIRNFIDCMNCDNPADQLQPLRRTFTPQFVVTGEGARKAHTSQVDGNGCDMQLLTNYRA